MSTKKEKDELEKIKILKYRKPYLPNLLNVKIILNFKYEAKYYK